MIKVGDGGSGGNQGKKLGTMGSPPPPPPPPGWETTVICLIVYREEIQGASRRIVLHISPIDSCMRFDACFFRPLVPITPKTSHKGR